jgi:trimethylamine--corrinoid protein Co-methyltransferase
MTDHLIKGIEVSEQTLLVEEIDRVGPGGNYLDSKVTLNHFRDYWFPGLLDRRRRQPWLDKGGLTMGQRLNARVRQIIAEHRPKPLAAEKSRMLREVLAAVG